MAWAEYEARYKPIVRSWKAIESAVKSIFEPSKITRHMFLANRMKSTRQAILYITQHGAHPLEAPESIRDDVTAMYQTRLGEAGIFLLRKATHTTQLGFLGSAVWHRLYGSHERGFAARSSPALTSLFTSQVGAVHFDTSSRPISTFALHHDLHLRRTQFMQRLTALFFGCVFFKKTVQSEALLKLNRIIRHDRNLQLFSGFNYAGTTDSIAEPDG